MVELSGGRQPHRSHHAVMLAGEAHCGVRRAVSRGRRGNLRGRASGRIGLEKRAVSSQRKTCHIGQILDGLLPPRVWTSINSLIYFIISTGFEPALPPIQGAKAVVETWKAWGALPNVTITFGTQRVEAAASGDLAYDYGGYNFAFDSDQGPFAEEGKYIVVWKKINGAWMVAADIFNNNSAP